MPKGDYLPDTVSGRLNWLANFNNKISGYQATFQLTTGSITGTAADYAAFSYAVTTSTIFKAYVQDFNGYLAKLDKGDGSSVVLPVPPIPVPGVAPATVVPGIFKRARDLVRRIKGHPAYTTNIGEDLLIEGAVESASVATGPTGTITAISGYQARIDFKKRGTQGVSVETKRGDETEWTFLDKSLVSPFVDTRAPLAAGTPEIRSYRLKFLKGGVAVEPPGPTLTVVVGP